MSESPWQAANPGGTVWIAVAPGCPDAVHDYAACLCVESTSHAVVADFMMDIADVEAGRIEDIDPAWGEVA